MKAKFLALAALVLGLASCQTDTINGVKVDANGEAPVNIEVALPEDVTRAAGTDSALGAIGNIDLTEDWDIRYILEVYDENGKLAKERMVNRELESTKTSFALRLVPGRDYKFVVWADFIPQKQADEADYHYNTKSLAKVTLSDDSYHHPMDESRDAYTGFEIVEKFSSTSPVSLTLIRPFAKLRVVTTDINELYSDLTYATVCYNADIYTSFDAIEGAVVKENAAINLTKAVNYADQNQTFVYEGEPTKDDKMTLFADYLFGAEDDRVMFTLKVKDATGLDIPTINFNTSIPVQRNHLTTIYGPVLTDANNVTVEIKDSFENSKNPEDKPYYVEIISGVKDQAMELTDGTYLFEDVTFNVEDGAAIVVSGDVVMDLMGLMTINAVEGIVVEDGASLTINGVGAANTRGAVRAGHLVVNASNGSAIGGEYITINNLAGLTAKANGDHAFGIGAVNAEVTIENTKIDYVCGGHVQAEFVNDLKYGKSEPEGGAAIGGAKIVINNSTITKAEGGSKAAAIGNSYWQSTEVVITDSELGDIFGGNASAAIGGSRYSDSITADNKQIVKVNIENSTITNAVGGQFGAGIGSGYDTHCKANETNSVNEIVIVKSNITANGGKYAAGIGTGFHAAALAGSIDAESVINATSGETFYKDSYTTAQNVGYAVIDPTREGKDLNVTFTVAGKAINIPTLPILGDDNTIISGLGKDYVNEDNYYISEPDALYYITEQVNGGNEEYIEATINLSNDIDLLKYATRSTSSNWTPIGTEDTVFEGTFDGKGYTIKNLNLVYAEPSYYIGFFGCVENATIKNITFDNVYVNVASDDSNEGGHIAAIAGYAMNTTFENITVKGDVKVESTFENNASSRVAVVAGGNYGGEVVMKNVVVNANDGSYVKANNCVGALAGQLQGKVVFENCSSNIDVTGYKFFAGGLIGLSAADSKFVSCSTSGNVTITNGRSGNNNDLYRVGAIAGGWDEEVNNPCLLTECSYTGELRGASADGRTATAFDCGGFVGRGYSTKVGAKISVNGTVYEYAGEGVYTINGLTPVATAVELVATLADDESALLANDITSTAIITVKSGAILDGGNNTITFSGTDSYESSLAVTEGTLQNVTVKGAYRALGTGGSGSYPMTGDAYFKNVTTVGATYGFNISCGNGHKIYVEDCVIGDWNSYAGLSGATFTDCTFIAQGNYKAAQRAYGDVTFTYENCTFPVEDPYDNQKYHLNGKEGKPTFVFKNCKMSDGTVLTKENFTTYFGGSNCNYRVVNE